MIIIQKVFQPRMYMSSQLWLLRLVAYLAVIASFCHPVLALAQGGAPRTLTVLTYNILGDARDAEERMPTLLSLIKSTDADIIALQEFKPWAMTYFLKEDWIKNYSYPVKDGKPFFAHGLLILSKGPISGFSALALPSHQNRMLLKVETAIDGVQYSVATCHLDSYLEDGPRRARQLDVYFRELGNSPNAFLLGDFNFGDGEQPETDHLNRSFLDVWKVLYSGNPGFTWNIEVSPMAKQGSFPNEVSRRLDRILFNSTQLQGKAAEIIGSRPVRAELPMIFPSDHFGLVARFTVMEK